MTDYELRKAITLAKWKWDFFQKPLDKKEKEYEVWMATREEQAEKRGLKYMDFEKLYEDYIIGAIDEQTFKRQKKLYHTVISDNIHRREKMEFLRKNAEPYKREYEALLEYKEQRRRNRKKARSDRYLRKLNGKKKMYYDPTKNRSKYNQPKIERNKEKFGKGKDGESE